MTMAMTMFSTFPLRSYRSTLGAILLLRTAVRLECQPPTSKLGSVPNRLPFATRFLPTNVCFTLQLWTHDSRRVIRALRKLPYLCKHTEYLRMDFDIEPLQTITFSMPHTHILHQTLGKLSYNPGADLQPIDICP
jgi:hypothetical protein